MSEEPEDLTEDLTEVRRRLREMQVKNRGRIRWNVSRHTAEMAIEAIEAGATRETCAHAGKRRRRKRHKRLL